jgi:hypothetical protein
MQSPLAPQYFGFVSGSMHTPSQTIIPALQFGTHFPSVHIIPASQREPTFAPAQVAEAPQNARSVIGSMHFASHRTWPGRQLAEH